MVEKEDRQRLTQPGNRRWGTTAWRGERDRQMGRFRVPLSESHGQVQRGRLGGIDVARVVQKLAEDWVPQSKRLIHGAGRATGATIAGRSELRNVQFSYWLKAIALRHEGPRRAIDSALAGSRTK